MDQCLQYVPVVHIAITMVVHIGNIQYMPCNIGGRYIECSESSRLSLLQHKYQCTRDVCMLFHYHEATMLTLFMAEVMTNGLNIKIAYHVTFSFLEVGAISMQQQGKNTVMENGDKLMKVSILCPLWQWSIFQDGPYWKPFP